MARPSDTSFVKEGAKVAVLASGGWHGPRLVGTSTIAKVGARDIVLANGRKFRAKDLSEQGRDRIYGDYLVSSKDPVLGEIKRRKERDDLRSKAHTAVDQWTRDRNDMAKAKAVVETMQAYLDGPEEE